MRDLERHSKGKKGTPDDQSRLGSREGMPLTEHPQVDEEGSDNSRAAYDGPISVADREGGTYADFRRRAAEATGKPIPMPTDAQIENALGTEFAKRARRPSSAEINKHDHGIVPKGHNGRINR